MLRIPRSRWSRAALLVAALVLLAVAALSSPETLMAAPAVLLVAALLAGWFPGATVLDRLRRTTRRPRRARPSRLSGVRRSRAGVTVRGGALLGLHLAGNAPPAGALVAR